MTSTDVTSGLSVLAESARLRKYVSTEKINNNPYKKRSLMDSGEENKKENALTILYSGETDNMRSCKHWKVGNTMIEIRFINLG